MTITYYRDLIQGSDEWHAARCGKLTASEMHLLLTPTLKSAKNDKSRGHLYELLGQRVTQHVEPSYISDAMLRGQDDEMFAREYYRDNHRNVDECGFITRMIEVQGVPITIGYSPDGLVGDRGLLECKSRKQRLQVETFLEWGANKVVPSEFLLQLQTGLWVTQRHWIDLASYCQGMPTCVMRVEPIDAYQRAITQAAYDFEVQMAALLDQWEVVTKGLKPSERRVAQEMFL